MSIDDGLLPCEQQDVALLCDLWRTGQGTGHGAAMLLRPLGLPQ